jgi:hypothetical protein
MGLCEKLWAENKRTRPRASSTLEMKRIEGGVWRCGVSRELENLLIIREQLFRNCTLSMDFEIFEQYG